MVTDGDLVEANVGHAQALGGGFYYVSLDVEIPVDALIGGREVGGPTGYLRLSANEADRLASQLMERAERVRALEGP